MRAYLEGVDGRDVLDVVHHLGEVLLWEGGDQQIRNHSLVGDVAGTKLGFRKGKSGRRL